MAPTLIPCSTCGCHAKSVETTCPSCGAELRRKDGSLPRTAAAVLLGLTTVTVGVGACGRDVVVEGGSTTTTGVSASSGGPAPAYGIAETAGSGAGGGTGVGGAGGVGGVGGATGAGGAGGATGAGGAAGFDGGPAPAYGIATTVGGGFDAGS